MPDLDLDESDSSLEDADKVDRRKLQLPEQQGPKVKMEPNIHNLEALLARGDRDLQRIENKRLQKYLNPDEDYVVAAPFVVVSALSFNPGAAFSASISNSKSLLAQLSLVRQNAVEKGCG